MKDCVCGLKNDFYFCRSCKVYGCKEHKKMHEEGNLREHNY